MTAAIDEARARVAALVSHIREGGSNIYEERLWDMEETEGVDRVLSLIREARDEGARAEMDRICRLNIGLTTAQRNAIRTLPLPSEEPK